MTSAVHGGIHNVSRHVVGVGCVGVISSIYELVVLTTGPSVNLFHHRPAARFPRQFPFD